MVQTYRKLNDKYRKWQAGSRRIIWAKLNGYTHIFTMSVNKEQVDEIFNTYDKNYK